MTISSIENIPLVALELSVRTNNALVRAGCTTLGRLQRAIDSNSLGVIRNLGVLSIAEIEEKMGQYLLENGVQHNPPFPIENSEQEPFDSSGVSEKPQILDIRAITDLQLKLLTSYLHKDQIKLLSDAGIETVGQLNDIIASYFSFLSPNEELLGKTIRTLSNRLHKQILAGSLSADLRVGKLSLEEFLRYLPATFDESLDYLQTLKQLTMFDNLNQELDFAFSSLTERQEYYYLKYNLEQTTLEALSQEEDKTRERIRQIIRDSRKKLEAKFSQKRLDYVNSALAIAKKLEGELSRDTWESELESRQIVQPEESGRTMNRFFAILSDKKFSLETFEIPETVSIILKKPADMPVYVLKASVEISSKQFREVNRRVMFTGGIHKDAALEILGCKPEELTAILAHRGLVEVTPEWFSICEAPVGDSRQPLFQAGLRMWQFCGPLPFETFLDGLQRYISRHYDTLSPAEVVFSYLEKLRFKIEDGIVTYEGEETVSLSGSELLALRIVDEQGPVVSFQEMVTGFIESGYSAASATSKVMRGSPVVERIGSGYYKKRGVIHSADDLERVMARQEAAEREPTISITSDGKLRYQTWVNSWAQGGVLSVGKLSQYFPNLSDGCPIFVGDKACGTLTGSETLIWGLSPAFAELDVRFGDYIELEFETKKQLKVFVNVLQRRDERSSAGSQESPNVDSLTHKFLVELHAKALTRTSLHAQSRVTDKRYFSTSAGKKAMTYGYNVLMDKGRVDLYINNEDQAKNKEEFHALYQHKAEIESLFGAPLEWDLLPNGKASRIRYTVSEFGVKDTEHWGEFQDLLIDAMIRLEKAFRPFLIE